MSPAKFDAAASLQDEPVLCCPLCITELDSTERAWAPCACGYQLCLFCYDRIKTEFSGQCPGCRTPYDSEFQINLVQRKEAANHAQHSTGTASPGAGSGASSSPGTQPSAAATGGPSWAAPPSSPGRDLHFEQEQLWPSLPTAAAAPAQPARASAAAAGASRHISPRDSPPPVNTSRSRPITDHPQLQTEGSTSGSCSSATTATTPQSPASSVISYRARAASSVVEQLQGTCHVSLAPSALSLPPVDEKGAALALSLQEAVRAGSLGVRQAAASLVSYLRQKQLQQQQGLLPLPGPQACLHVPAAAAAAQAQQQLQQLQQHESERQRWLFASSSGNSSSGGGDGLAAKAGRCNAYSTGLLAGLRGAALLGTSPFGNQLESSPSIAVSEAPTFAQWARGDSQSLAGVDSFQSMGAGLFDGWAISSPHASTSSPPVRSRLPLYARGPASLAAAGAKGTPASSFPGFAPTQHPESPVQQQRALAPGVMSPPGFSRSMLQHQRQPLFS